MRVFFTTAGKVLCVGANQSVGIHPLANDLKFNKMKIFDLDKYGRTKAGILGKYIWAWRKEAGTHAHTVKM
jgi:hypothetical protein